MTELYHYGVKGMKWGVRRSKRKYIKRSSQQYDYTQKIAKRVKKVIDTGYDPVNEREIDDELRKEYQREYDKCVEYGRQWIQTKQDIMNMTAPTIVSKDIKNRYKETFKKVKWHLAV